MVEISLTARKKSIFTLHDTTPVYAVVGLLALTVFLFSLSGLRLALGHPDYTAYAWVPSLLLLLSGLLIVTCAVRLIRRLFFRIQEKIEDSGDIFL